MCSSNAEAIAWIHELDFADKLAVLMGTLVHPVDITIFTKALRDLIRVLTPTRNSDPPFYTRDTIGNANGLEWIELKVFRDSTSCVIPSLMGTWGLY